MRDVELEKQAAFQFGLRALLIAILAMSLVLAGFASCMYPARKQKQAVAALQQVGQVYYDREVDWDPDTPPQWMVDLFGVDFYYRVVVANLYGERVTDDALQHLNGLPHLETLHIKNAHRISEMGFRYIGTLAELEMLTLYDCQLTDAALSHFKNLRSLRCLTLDSNPITDAGLEHLKEIPQLVHLSIRDTNVTPDGVEQLRLALPMCALGYTPPLENAGHSRGRAP